MPISLIFIIISLIAGITVYFTPRTPLYLKILPVFLLGCLLTEMAGSSLVSAGRSNVELYNVFSVYSASFYLYVLREIIQSRKVKKIVLGILLGFIVLAVVLISMQGMYIFNSTIYTTGSLLIIAIGIYYFFELFQLKHAINLAREPAFWIACGLLFFYCCSFLLLGLVNYLYEVAPSVRQNLSTILAFLNILLYSLFTIGFLCRIRFRKTVL